MGGDDSFTTNPDAKQGADLINDRLRGSDPMNETVIVRSETTTVDDPAFKAESNRQPQLCVASRTVSPAPRPTTI